MANDLKDRLLKLVERRDALKDTVSRVQGRLEAAQKDLAAVDEELKKRKVDPAKLDSVIQQLEENLDTRLKSLLAQVEAADKQLLPYVEE